MKIDVEQIKDYAEISLVKLEPGITSEAYFTYEESKFFAPELLDYVDKEIYAYNYRYNFHGEVISVSTLDGEFICMAYAYYFHDFHVRNGMVT